MVRHDTTGRRKPSLVQGEECRSVETAVKRAKFYYVETGIEMPQKRFAHAKYPWDLMEIGQSFFVPGDPVKAMNSVTSCRRYAQKRYGTRYAIRTVEGGVRVWRIG